ncbi:ATP-binding protein [Streptomyces sp. ST2-7A]|uniref:ATP-binding protein n=1 Tax=Streptomyces sp. ST2-7A TaxID=2907214 RepID=UPI001F24967C|nr:ATP-binding protein [Streptomyces sp. ST2-7A]MCE7083400.1 ATP-binding protein [Streptomyces sp. ST2-7A]
MLLELSAAVLAGGAGTAVALTPLLLRDRRRASRAERSGRLTRNELYHLARTRVPAVAASARGTGGGQPIPGPSRPDIEGTELEQAARAVLEAVHHEVARIVADAEVARRSAAEEAVTARRAAAEEMAEARRVAESAGVGADETLHRITEEATRGAENATRSALRGAMAPVTAQLHRLQAQLDALLVKHERSQQVAGVLLELDPLVAQALRRAQATLVLAGDWPGRQRVDAAALDVVRAATGRIADGHRRVHIIGEPTIAVTGRVVEPVVLAIAELLDNAARHSSPASRVEVRFRSDHHGLSLLVDDGGVGLTRELEEQAEEVLSKSHDVRLTELPAPLAAGWAVVGLLARRYGFRASAVPDGSPYGGTRMVIHLPNELLTPLPMDEEEIGGAPPEPAPRASVPAPAPAPARESLPGPEDEPAPEPLPTRRAARVSAEPRDEGGWGADHRVAADRSDRRDRPEPADHRGAPAGYGDGGFEHSDSGEFSEEDEELTPGGLPQRRRRRHAAPEEPAGWHATVPRPAAGPPSRLGAAGEAARAFRAAFSGDAGPTPPTPPTPGDDEVSTT